MVSGEAQPGPGPAARFSAWTRWIAGALILLPPLGLAVLIANHQVNMPFLDDWMFVEMLQKAREGRLTLHDFWKAQMEHRISFVRLVILVRDWLSPTDVRPQFWVSWLMLVGTGINVAALMRRTVGGFRRWWLPMLLASMVLFTPLQYQIVLWAMMFQVACPVFFLSTAMVTVMSDRLPPWVRFGVAIVCAECGMLSFASGLQIWVLLIPLILWSAPFSRPGGRWLFLGAWVFVFAASAGLYFHDLKNEADPAFSYGAGEEETMKQHVGGFLSDPGRGVAFVLGFLGSHLARGTSASMLELAKLFGGMSLLFYAVLGGWWLLRFQDTVMRNRWLPWLLLGGYSIGTAALTALGRAWATKDADGSIAARYVIHAIPLTVALIVLGCLAAEEWRRRRPGCGMGVIVGQTIATSALFMVLLNGWVHGAHIMGVWESSRLRSATNTLFFNVLEVEGNVAPSRPRAAWMNTLGLLDPPMLKNTRLDNFKISGDPPGRGTARLSNLFVIGNKLSASGIAGLHARRRAADGVFVTYRDDAGDWVIFHVTQVREMPLYLDAALDRDLRFTHVPNSSKRLGEALTAFTGTCGLDRIPPGRREIRAWIFDYKKQTVYPMSGRFMVDSAAREVKELGPP